MVPCGSRYHSNICATSAASAGSARTADARRGRSGSSRYPNGGVVHGSSVPARSLACRPRRIRSVISVRSYSATAPRICSSSWSRGSELIGRSRNSTWQPRAASSSISST